MKLESSVLSGEFSRATPGQRVSESGSQSQTFDDDLRHFKTIKPDPGVDPIMQYGSSPFVIMVILAIGYMVIK